MPKKILLVNGNQGFMSVIKKILERNGYLVRCAVGMSGARELLLDFTPDAVLLNRDLPDGTGFDYCRELRKNNLLPVMFISGDKDDELPALQAGAVDFMRKPFDFAIMKARLDIMLNTQVSLPLEWETREYSTHAGSDELRPQATRTETAVEPESKPMPRNIGRYGLVAAVCLLFILTGTLMFIVLGDRQGHFGISDNNTQLTETEIPFKIDKTAKLYAESDPCIIIPDISDIVISAGSAKIKMTLADPTENSCYFVFEIILADTGETIYSSDFVEPGKCIEEVSMSRELPAGEYDAIMEIHPYEIADLTPMHDISVDFHLKVY